MATTTSKTPQQLPNDLQEAIDRGVLTQEQLQELIAFEAGTIGLDFDEAVRGAYEDTLPRNATGADLKLLVSLLAT